MTLQDMLFGLSIGALFCMAVGVWARAWYIIKRDLKNDVEYPDEAELYRPIGERKRKARQ